ncbi:hypothetical protein R1sor_026667 [Riccia sorocarpa]|uniref:Uncharacterized protein n=1 Tax=Riccia sorocarpa TaxID=122646 RepID=A0ABD3GG50_9MARC
MEIENKGSSNTTAAVEETAVNRPDKGHQHEPSYGGRFSSAWWLEMSMSFLFDAEKELVPGLQSKSPVVRHAICSARASLGLARDSVFRAMGEISVAPPSLSPPPAAMAKLLTKSGRQNIKWKKHAGHITTVRSRTGDRPRHMFVEHGSSLRWKHCAA